jgi:hypothetical protein
MKLAELLENTLSASVTCALRRTAPPIPPVSAIPLAPSPVLDPDPLM